MCVEGVGWKQTESVVEMDVVRWMERWDWEERKQVEVVGD